MPKNATRMSRRPVTSWPINCPDLSMPIEGCAELVENGVLSGWVWNPADPGRALHVEAFNGDVFYHRTVADGFRGDLLKAGKRAGHCSFEIPLPDDLEGEVHVVLDGTGQRLPSSLTGPTQMIPDWLEREGVVFQPNVLVHRLTHALLGRPATRLELLKNVMHTGDVHALSRLVRTILASAPDPAYELSEEHLVSQTYLGVLSRVADGRGIEIYSNALRSGMPLANLIRELIQTPEFARTLMTAGADDNRAGDTLHDLAEALKAAVTTLMLHGTAVPARDATFPA